MTNFKRSTKLYKLAMSYNRGLDREALRWLERLPRRCALGSHAPEAVERAAVGRVLRGKPVRRHEKAGGRRWVVRAI